MLVEPTYHIFQFNGEYFIAKIVGSFCGDNWRKQNRRPDFTVFLVDGNDELITGY